jgi:hypothetical protein
LERETSGVPKGETLSSALATAFQADVDGTVVRDNWRHRVADHPTDTAFKRLANNILIEDDFVFGNLCVYSPGNLQAMLQLSGDDHRDLAEVLSELGVREAPAPEGHEFLHGMAYWLVTGDHVLAIQHQSLQVKALEEYFGWLLAERSGGFKNGSQIILKTVFDRNAVGGDLGEIKEVQVGGVVHPRVAESTGDVVEIDKQTSLGERTARFGKAREILESILGIDEADNLLRKMPEEAALEVAVRFSYRSKKRKLSRQALSDLAVGLRNLPDGEVTTSGKHGKSKGDDVRLSMARSVPLLAEGSTLLDLNGVFEVLKSTYLRFVEDDLI